MSISKHRDISSQPAVTNQPQANLDLGFLDLKQSIPFHEKSLETSLDNGHEQHCYCEHGQPSSLGHHACHNIRLRQLLLPAVLVLVALGSLLAWSCVSEYGVSDWGFDNLVGRAFGNTSSSIFAQNKCQ